MSSVAHREQDTGAAEPLRVTVLCGGPSREREVSLESGKAVADALRRKGHAVHVADINPDDLSALDTPTDVIFPALHGTVRGGGQLQAILEQRGIPFVGAGSAASALAMDKVRSKQAALEQGIPTAQYEVWRADTHHQRRHPYQPLPVVVKPVAEGSSVSVTIVKDMRDFLPAVEQTIAAHGSALVESFIKGAELTVGIVGDTELPPICIRPKRDFYDYDAKYRDNQTEYVFDAYPAEVLETTRQQSRRLHDAIGVRHLSRVDWIVDDEQRPWFLEINTLPGFTSHSLVPKAAAKVGIDFATLVDRLVRMARQERR